MKTPLIGITASTNSKKDDRLPAAYGDAVKLAGGAPLLIPLGFPLTALPALVARLDGLLLSGGGDIDPSLYPARQPEKCQDVLPERDQLELALLKAAAEVDLPVLGICRGMQVINVSRGGTLYTDLPSQYPSPLVHSTPEEKGRDSLVHEVTIETGSLLHGILAETNLAVNSFHHQAALHIGTGLQVVAHATDGLVEAVEDRSKKFFCAVQWHPECLQQKGDAHRRLFKAFIEAAKA